MAFIGPCLLSRRVPVNTQVSLLDLPSTIRRAMLQMPPFMKKFLLFGLSLFVAFNVARADVLDALGFGKRSSNPTATLPSDLPASLSQDQVVQGLKEALSKGVQQAVGSLGHEGGLPNQSERQDSDAGEVAHGGKDFAHPPAGQISR